MKLLSSANNTNQFHLEALNELSIYSTFPKLQFRVFSGAFQNILERAGSGTLTDIEVPRHIELEIYVNGKLVITKGSQNSSETDSITSNNSSTPSKPPYLSYEGSIRIMAKSISGSAAKLTFYSFIRS